MPTAEEIFNPKTIFGVQNPNYKPPSNSNNSDSLNRNTYNPATGVYIDNKGQGYSTATPSAGAKLDLSQASHSGDHHRSGSPSVQEQPAQLQQSSAAQALTPDQVQAQKLEAQRQANEQQIKDYYAKQPPGTYYYAVDKLGYGYSVSPDQVQEQNTAYDSQGRGYSIDPNILKQQEQEQKVREFFAPQFRGGQPAQSPFEKAAAAQQKRQAAFDESFNGVRNTANFLTFGDGMPYDERSFGGKVAENVMFGAMAAPIQIGGAVGEIAEKDYLALRYIYDPKFSRSQENIFERVRDVGAESFRAGKTTFETVYNPTTPEGASTYAGAALFALVPAAEKTIANRNALVLRDFSKAEQTGSDVLFTREVSRDASQRYIQSNSLPGRSDFLVSELVKSKQTEVSFNPQEVLLKFNLEDTGRTGTRSIVQDINTGRISIVDHIQAESALFRNGKGDFIRMIESTERPGEFKVQVYNTKDYLSNGKPFLEKTFIDSSASFSISNSKITNDFYLKQGMNSNIAEQSGSVIFSRDIVTGDYLQTTKYSYDVTQRAKLDRPYIVYSDKELANIFNSKESYIGVKEDYTTMKARPEFGEEQLYPNIVEREGFRVHEVKNPQIVSETFILKDVDISLRRLSAQESRAFIQKKGFEEKSFLGGRIKYYKGLDAPFSKRFGGSFIELNRAMFADKRASLGRSIELDRISRVNVRSASLDFFGNVKAFDISMPKLDFRTGNILQLIPGSGRAAIPALSEKSIPGFKNSLKQFSFVEWRVRQKNNPDITPKMSSVQENTLRQSSLQSSNVFQVQRLAQSEVQSQAKNNFRALSPRMKMPRMQYIFLPLPFKFKPFPKAKPGKKRAVKDSFGLRLKPRNYQRYVLPSLRAVNITEWQGVEAKVPRATRKIRNQSYAQLRGFDLTSIIPTEQMRIRRVKL